MNPVSSVLCMRHTLRLLLLLPLLLICAAEAAARPGESAIDFLYINANAGEAAGGHTALRLGESVFHYQFFPDASFLLVREPWESFRFLYNELHNRSIRIASLPLAPQVAESIRNRFTELLVEQALFFDGLEELEGEQRSVREMAEGGLELSVACLGFFATHQTPAAAGTRTLRLKIADELGAGSLAGLLAEAENNVQASVHGVNSGGRPTTLLQEALAWREALEVLSRGRGLDARALLPPMGSEKALSWNEKEGLQRFAGQLADGILRLLHSQRPDRGEALLLQLARYQAVQQSLATGQLVTLDPFAADTRAVQLSDEELAGESLRALQNDLQEQAARRRQLFFQEVLHPELAYSLLETSRARAWELSRAGDVQRRVRILTGVTLPTRPATVFCESLRPDGDGLPALAALLEKKGALLRKEREERYGYNLFSRNCATELIRSLNSVFAGPRSGKAALGGWLEPDSGLLFIPFLSYEQWISTFPVQDESFLPARRLRRLQQLYAEEGDFRVWLRESNTLTSTLYQPRGKDTPFLFFTDDSLLLRPVQGLFNIGYGALHGAVGLLSLPVDGGTALQQAARGIFYSLPELGFSNIRKGSYSTGAAGDSQR